jgi:hypothetical protein
MGHRKGASVHFSGYLLRLSGHRQGRDEKPVGGAGWEHTHCCCLISTVLRFISASLWVQSLAFPMSEFRFEWVPQVKFIPSECGLCHHQHSATDFYLKTWLETGSVSGDACVKNEDLHAPSCGFVSRKLWGHICVQELWESLSCLRLWEKMAVDE